MKKQFSIIVITIILISLSSINSAQTEDETTDIKETDNPEPYIVGYTDDGRTIYGADYFAIMELDPISDDEVDYTADDGDQVEGSESQDTSRTTIYVISDTDANNRYWANLRFRKGAFPKQGATVSVAYIEAYVYPNTDDANLDIYAEDLADPLSLNDAGAIAIIDKTLTTESAEWVADDVGSGYQNTPSLVDVVQELVDDYTPSAMSFVFKPNTDEAKTIRFFTYDLAGTTYSAKLHLEWIGTAVIEDEVEASSDDAIEYENDGTMYLTNTNIYIKSDSDSANRYWSAVRFSRGAFPPVTGTGDPTTITSAYIEVYGYPTHDDANFDIYAEVGAAPVTFTTNAGDITDRTLTDAYTSWIEDSVGIGAWSNSPPIVDVIQELVDTYTVTSIVLIFKPKADVTKEMQIAAGELLLHNGVHLHIEWTEGTVTDTTPPIIDFQSPTPNNETLAVKVNWAFINMTSDETLSNASVEWDGVNYTMLPSNWTSWYLNKTGLANGNYSFKVWGNDTSNNNGTSKTRWVEITNCYKPVNDLTITTNATLCHGVYNITDSGSEGIIIINANHLTLTCNNTHINGSSAAIAGVGIKVSSKINITIKDCTISYYGHGIYLNNIDDSWVLNNTIYNVSMNGINFDAGSQNNVISNNTLYWNNDGITISNCDNNTIEYNNASNNRYDGIHLAGDTGSNNIIRHSITNSNGNDGILIHPSTTGFYYNITVYNITAYNNTYNGIIYFQTNGSILYNLDLQDNSETGAVQAGIRLNNVTNFNISNSTIIGNRKDFQFVNNARNIIFLNVTANTDEFSSEGDGCGGCNYTRQWYVNFNVTNSINHALEDANVTVYDKWNNYWFSNFTEANGFTGYQTLTEYNKTSTITERYTNYTANVSKTDYINASQSFNFTGNIQINISLITSSVDTCTYVSLNWDVDCSDNCVISTDVDMTNHNLSLNGTGTFTVNANITNIDVIRKDNNCMIVKRLNEKMG